MVGSHCCSLNTPTGGLLFCVSVLWKVCGECVGGPYSLTHSQQQVAPDMWVEETEHDLIWDTARWETLLWNCWRGVLLGADKLLQGFWRQNWNILWENRWRRQIIWILITIPRYLLCRPSSQQKLSLVIVKTAQVLPTTLTMALLIESAFTMAGPCSEFSHLSY